MSYFDVMDPVVRTDNINSVIRAQICPSDGQVIDLEVDCEVEDNVELGAIYQDQIVDRGIDG